MCSPISLPTLFYHHSCAYSEMSLCNKKKERLGYKKSIRVEENLNMVEESHTGKKVPAVSSRLLYVGTIIKNH